MFSAFPLLRDKGRVKIGDKTMTKEEDGLTDLIMSFMDEFVQSYYVVERPVLKKHDDLYKSHQLGYRPETIYKERKKESQSILFLGPFNHPEKKLKIG